MALQHEILFSDDNDRKLMVLTGRDAKKEEAPPVGIPTTAMQLHLKRDLNINDECIENLNKELKTTSTLEVNLEENLYGVANNEEPPQEGVPTNFTSFRSESSDEDYFPDEDEIRQLEEETAEDIFDQNKNENATGNEEGNNMDTIIIVEPTEADNSERVKKRSKRANVDPSKWKSEMNEKNRELGKIYKGRRLENGKWNYNVPKSEKTLKGRCNCKIADNKKSVIKCSEISDTERNDIFSAFWKLGWREKKLFVQLNVSSNQTQRSRGRKDETKSRREKSFQYYLKKNDSRIRVCKRMFLNTLNIGEWCVHSWKNTENPKPIPAKGLKKQKEAEDELRKRIRNERKASLLEFFENLPKMESHYCRSTTTKLYLEPIWQSKQQLYRVYCNDWCNEKQIKPFSNAYFFNTFDDKNLSLFTRKKDECDLCVGRNTKSINEEEYELHQKKKQEARNEKQADKGSDHNKIYTVDLQAVMVCPKSNVSAVYYKTKLAVHNFVIYVLKSNDAHCFIWNEIEGTVGANEFASIMCYFAETQLEKLTVNEELVFFSDRCTAQNRNGILANAFLNFAVCNNVRVVQKYLERGHTQMEADSIHSCIERKIRKQNINVPADYVDICKQARQNPRPYNVKYLDHTFFKDYSNINYVSSIRPGKKAGDPMVVNIRALRYNPNATIDYKLRHSDDWNELPQRINRSVAPVLNFPILHKERLPIKKKKYGHLQELKQSLEVDYHSFYDELPYHENE